MSWCRKSLNGSESLSGSRLATHNGSGRVIENFRSRALLITGLWVRFLHGARGSKVVIVKDLRQIGASTFVDWFFRVLAYFLPRVRFWDLTLPHRPKAYKFLRLVGWYRRSNINSTIDIVSEIEEDGLMSRIQERRREEKEMRRQSIIDAAEQVFAQRGFEVATMADIADQARLSRALIYFYFKDKEELGLAITARGLQALRRSFERASAKYRTGLEKATGIGQA